MRKINVFMLMVLLMVFAGQVVGYTGENPDADAVYNRAAAWGDPNTTSWGYHVTMLSDIEAGNRGDSTCWELLPWGTRADYGDAGGYYKWTWGAETTQAGAWENHLSFLWNSVSPYKQAEVVVVFTAPATGDYNVVGDILFAASMSLQDCKAYVHIGTAHAGVYTNLWSSGLLNGTTLNTAVAIPGFTGNAALLGIALEAGDQLMVSLQSGISNYRRSNLIDTDLQIEYLTPSVTAEDPVPANDATRIEQNLATLAWQDTDVVSGESYDVYLAKDGDALVKIDTVDEGVSSCAVPAVLEPATLYNWRVDTVQGATIDTGGLWSFTTGGMAVNPAPTDGAEGVSTMPTLAWEGDRDGTSYIEEYDVYVDFGSGLELQTTTDDTSYTVTTELSDGTAYSWQVVAKHGGTEIVSTQPTWSFTTGKLLAYWTLDDVDDPNDEIAFVNDGLCTMLVGSDPDSKPDQVAGVFGNAVRFDGDSCFALMDQSGYWDNTNKGLTIALWGKWDANQDWAPIVTKSNEIVGKTWAIPRVNGGWDLHLYKTYFRPQLILDGPDDRTAEIQGSAIYDDWHHLVVTYSPQGRQMWIDGILNRERDGVAPFNVGDAPVSIGGRVDAAGLLEQGLIGTLDEVYVYDRPLAEAQIMDLYKNSSMAKLPDPANGEVEVAFDTLLSWTPGSDGLGIASQTLTYSTNSDLSDATVVSGLAADASSYDTDINLELGYKYFWKVESCDAAGDLVCEATVWSFTVMKLGADIVVNKIVEISDLQALTADWLDDARSVPSEGVLPWNEDYTSNNMDDYLYVYGGVYAETWWELGIPVAEPNFVPTAFVPTLSTSAEWQLGDMTTAGSQIQCEVIFSEPVDLTDVAKVRFWVRPVGVLDADYNNATNDDGWFICWCFDDVGTFASPTLRPVDPNDSEPINPNDGEPINWTEASAANDGAGEWVKMEWDTSTFTNTWAGFAMWTRWREGGNVGGHFEFADIELIYEGVVEPTCWFGADFSEADINNDCDVNLLDFAELGLVWLLDANNY